MTDENWNDGNALALGVYLDGSDAPDTAADGSLLYDDDFLVLVNGWWEPLDFTIGDCRPGLPPPGLSWTTVIDTFTVGPRSVQVLRAPRAGWARVLRCTLAARRLGPSWREPGRRWRGPAPTAGRSAARGR